MGGIPDLMFVIDTNKENIAIKEAKKLGIPVAAMIDSNCDPDEVNYPIPGNDDAARCIQYFCDLIADAALDGLAEGQSAAGYDLGSMENPVEPVLAQITEEFTETDVGVETIVTESLEVVLEEPAQS
jgi:small subunit ribosomal protein S2